VKTKDEQEVLRHLADTIYSGYLSKHSGKNLTLNDIDSAIFDDYYRILEELMNTRITKLARHLLETTYRRHEFSCLKIIMRLVSAGASDWSSELVNPIGRYTTEHILRLLRMKDIRQVISEIDNPRVKVLALDRVGDCEKTNSTLPVEMAIDKYYLNSLWGIANELESWDRDPVRDIVGTEIDATNMDLILRGKQLGMTISVLRDLLIPIQYKLDQELESAIESTATTEAGQALASGYYRRVVSQAVDECERKRTLLPFELALKRFLAERCSRTFIGYPFGIGPILAFLNLKYLEAQDIRTIFLGKRDRVSNESLRSLLVSSPSRES